MLRPLGLGRLASRNVRNRTPAGEAAQEAAFREVAGAGGHSPLSLKERMGSRSSGRKTPAALEGQGIYGQLRGTPPSTD